MAHEAANTSMPDDEQAPDASILARAEQLRLLFRQSYPAVFISFITAALLTAILWPVQDHVLLLTWFGILGLSSLFRLALFYLYRETAPAADAVLTWERPYFLTLILSSLIWGLGGIIIMPTDSPLHQVVIYYFLIGMSGGALSVYSAHRGMLLATLVSVLLPVTAWFLAHGGYLHIGMGIGGLIFLGSALRASNVISNALQQNFQLNYQLKEAHDEAKRLARIDELTGLYNRRAFYEFGELMLHQCRRNQSACALILLDIDHFKRVNDNYGHATGDAALRDVANRLTESLRKTDISGRIGGEEFAILLPGTRLDRAAEVAEKLRQHIEEARVQFLGIDLGITASFGVTAGLNDLEMLMRNADEALYQAKAEGRNRVVSTALRVIQAPPVASGRDAGKGTAGSPPR